MKKTLSILLAACMLMTLSFSFIVLADDDLTVTYWNADRAGVMVEFSKPVAAAALSGKAYILADGVKMEAVIESSKAPNVASGWGNLDIVDKAGTILIKPTGGLTIGNAYQLVLEAGITETGGAALNEAYSKTFRLTKLLYDNFDDYNNVDKLITSVWNMGAYVSSLTVEDGKMKIMSGADNMIVEPKGMSSQLTWSDYTFEFDATLVDTTIPPEPPSTEPQSLYGMAYNSGGGRTGSGLSKYMLQFNYGASNGLYFRTWESSPRLNLRNTTGILKNVKYNAKIVLKGGNIKSFVDGEKCFEVNDSVHTAGSIGFSTSTGGKTFFVDNVYVTKAVELDSMPVSVKYLNADRDGVIVDFSEEVNVDSLQGRVTLLKNGTPMDNVAVTSSKADSAYVGWGATAVEDSACTVLIRPDEGLNDDDIYQLRLGYGISNKIENRIMGAPFQQTFKLETLFEDNFDSYNEQNPITKVWTAIQWVSSLTVDQEQMKIVSTKDSMLVVPKDYEKQLSWTNYTFSYDVILSASMPGFMGMCYNQGGAYSVGPKYNMQMRTDNASGVWLSSPGNPAMKDALRSANAVVAGETHKAKMVLKDGNIKAFFDGKKHFDINDSYAVSGSIGFSGSDANSKAYYIDNVSVTKIVLIQDIVKLEFRVTDDDTGEETYNITGKNSISASLKLGNNTASTMPVKVIFGLFKSENELQEVFVVTDLNEISPNGEITAEIDEVPVGEATLIKAFVWNSLNELTPYMLPVTPTP